MEGIANKERGSDVEVTPARPEDAEGISDSVYHAWLATYPNEEVGITKDDIEHRFKERRTEANLQRSRESLRSVPSHECWLTARAGGRVVGVLRAVREEKRNKLQALYVHPDSQGKGVGTKLWRAAQGYLDQSKDTFVEVAAYNQRAIAFYEGLGFKDTGRRFEDERFRMRSGAVIPEIEMKLEAS